MKWTDKFESIIIYEPRLIDKFNLNDLTKDFLIKVGLPKYAAPFLSFVENNDIQYEGILRLTEYFTFLKSEYDKYVVVGSNGDGDMIVIDTRYNCKIKLLDHEASFSEKLINSPIEKLYSSLLIYQHFIDCIIEENGDDALIDNNFNDAQVNDLKQRLIDNDSPSMADNSFWFQEFETLIANRNENK